MSATKYYPSTSSLTLVSSCVYHCRLLTAAHNDPSAYLSLPIFHYLRFHRMLKHFHLEAIQQALEDSQVLVPYQNELQCCEGYIQPPSANKAA